MTDITIKNSNIVLPGGIFSGGVAVEGQKIVAIAKDSALPQADRVIDAKGKYLMPGVIDPHTHAGCSFPGCNWEEDIKNVSKAAVYGGVTTFFTFFISKAFPSYKAFVAPLKELVTDQAFANVGLHPGITTTEQAQEIPDYFKMGLTSYKFWFAYKGKEGEQLGITASNDGLIYDAWRRMAELSRQTGWPTLACAHCENNEITFFFKERLRAEGRNDLAAWSDSRPIFNEEESMRKAIFLSQVSGCPLYIVHVSIGSGVDMVARAKAEGVNVTMETLAHYLTLTKDYKHPVNEFIPKVNTPLRDNENIEKLWKGIRDGVVECIGTDHCTLTKKR